MRKLNSILHKVNNSSISVFFPCYNDSGTIGNLVETAIDVLKEIADDYEVIIVDDGSTDKSRSLLRNLAKKHKEVKPIFHKKNKGYGGALISGFKAATKELIFYTDGDGQYDVNELTILLVLMTDDVNFVNGVKMARHDPTYRIVLGKFYSMIMRWGFWLPIEDVDCDFRLIRKSIIEKIDLESSSGSICVELIKKAQRAGAVFRQVSVHHYEREWGSSQFFRPGRLLRTFKDLSVLWFRLMLRDKYNRVFKYVSFRI